MSLNYCAIGQRIKEIRKHNQLSQAMLSELVDKSPTYISYIESGSKSMSLETFVQIANALEIPTDLLLTEEVKGSPVAASQEITMIMSDCSAYERFIIIDTIKTLKTAFREHKYLLKRNSR
ncbi:MAG: helix-turn-helix transcriptional regulator [Oscillospiraceae bacterium]